MGDVYTANLPTVNAWQPVFAGAQDMFVAHYAPGHVEPLLLTYLGGAGSDSARGVAVAQDGDVVVVGDTTSTDFPVVRPVQSRHGGGRDAVLVRMDVTGRWLEYSTFLGGWSDESLCQLALDGFGNAYVVGTAHSADFPVTDVSIDRNWSRDVFLLSLDDVGRWRSSALLDTGTMAIPARDVYARPIHAAVRGDESVLVVGTYFSDDLLRGGVFLTLTDFSGTPFRTPRLIEAPAGEWCGWEAATSDATRVFLVTRCGQWPPLRRYVRTLPIGGSRRETEWPERR